MCWLKDYWLNVVLIFADVGDELNFSSAKPSRSVGLFAV